MGNLDRSRVEEGEKGLTDRKKGVWRGVEEEEEEEESGKMQDYGEEKEQENTGIWKQRNGEFGHLQRKRWRMERGKYAAGRKMESNNTEVGERKMRGEQMRSRRGEVEEAGGKRKIITGDFWTREDGRECWEERETDGRFWRGDGSQGRR